MGVEFGAIASEDRRRFMQAAGVAAGVTLAGVGAASAQVPTAKKQAPGGVGPQTPRPFRASPPQSQFEADFGPLAELAGTWVGRGFNFISLPDFDNPQGPQAFRVKVNATHEILEFHPIGGAVPNRGSTGQKDINLFGMTYLQRISDALTSEAMHIEPGFWLNVPETEVPKQGATVVRMGSIPHGTSVMAQGKHIPVVNGGPKFAVASTTPFTGAGPIKDPVYLAPFDAAVLPPGFRPPFLQNPNLALETAIVGQTITKTVVLSVSTKADPAQLTGGGLLNIPFLDSNAKATQMDAVFWIETVLQPDGKTTFMQLQYTQTVVLDFLKIRWPHISVATLIKQ